MTLTNFSEYQNLPLFAIAEFPGQSKETTSKDRSSTCKAGIQYMQSRYPEAEVITDIGSGLDFKRRGLLSILDRLHGGEKLTVVVAYRDRLARFGAELIERLIEQNGGQLVVHNQVTHSPQHELAEDILAILNVFSARLNGLRRYSNKIKADQDIPHSRTEGADP